MLGTKLNCECGDFSQLSSSRKSDTDLDRQSCFGSRTADFKYTEIMAQVILRQFKIEIRL